MIIANKELTHLVGYLADPTRARGIIVNYDFNLIKTCYSPSMYCFCVCQFKQYPSSAVRLKTIQNQTYPSATKNSPLLSTATEVGLQNRELPVPGTSFSPKTSRRCVRSLNGENLKTYKNKEQFTLFLAEVRNRDHLPKPLFLKQFSLLSV